MLSMVIEMDTMCFIIGVVRVERKCRIWSETTLNSKEERDTML